MSKQCRTWITNDFYCINCGAKGIPIPRAGNKLKLKGHRKKMYCPNCRHDTNHVECRNMYEVNEFLENFKNGVYIEEAKETLEHERQHLRSALCDVRGAGLG